MVTFAGIKNTVRAARLFFKNIKFNIDEDSFEILAKKIGDIEVEHGFIVDNMEKIQLLCEIGKFQICVENGIIVAKASPKSIGSIIINTFVGELVVKDMQARIDMGIKKYGTKLQTNNGRDALQDAYEEALDLVMYLKQIILERDGK